MKISPYILVLNFLLGMLVATAQEAPQTTSQSVSFTTGKHGLARDGGYLRGVPLGELAGWTASLWFRSDAESSGDLMGIVMDQESNQIIRLIQDGGNIQLKGLFKNSRMNTAKPEGWEMNTVLAEPENWHQAVITYSQADGISFYVDGQFVDSGERNWLGYAINFNNYHFGARVLPTGEIDHYYQGLLDDFVLYERWLNSEEVAQWFEGTAPTDPIKAFNDFENVNHRELARFTESDRDQKYLDEGKRLYELNCIACHSKDGISPPLNPLARAFSKNKMENGGDPYSMFKTITYGFRNMMASPQLNPEQRYKVIHYIREKLVRTHASDLYVELDAGYTDPMPSSPAESGEAAARAEALAKVGYLRDYGRALITPVSSKKPQNRSRNALVIDLGNETTIAYDLGSMRTIGAWQGGFLDFSNTLHHLLRAPGLPAARFNFIPGMDSGRWAWNGKAETPLPVLKPNTIYPEDQMRYRGHYPFGDEITISYDVQGRGVLESPLAETQGATSILHRRLSIEPGANALELVVLGVKGATPRIQENHVRIDVEGGRHLVWLQGDYDGSPWLSGADGELVLKVPASDSPLHLDVAMAFQTGDGATVLQPGDRAMDLSKRTKGSPRRWTETHTMKGRLAADSFQGYALDNLPVPLKNAYNSWMRTAALAFFPDGRLAVSTLNGDVWMVSGVDDALEHVSWQRFAAGLYEPLGMKVVDGVLAAITRGRIVKLHDYNKDGEADFYEAFFNEEEPSDGWHAYSFDLEVGEDGSYYYARVGGFSDWSTPGGLVRVSRDGDSVESLGVGMRVPNGIGRLPDGRITFGDNQGTYVPASKIAIASEPGFHGAGKWTEREGNFDPTQIVDPIVYMPQELDSSAGSQLWVKEDERFGPLGGQYFHTSFGRASIMYVMMDTVGDLIQGTVFPLPLKMESGTMRVAKNPTDRQLYFSGLTGWQAGATREGSIQRLRYTENKGLYVIDAKARQGRLELQFNRPLNPSMLEDTSNWDATMWNYQWSKAYGSPHFKVTEPGIEGVDTLTIGSRRLSHDGTRLIVEMPDLLPCHTLKLDFSVVGTDAQALKGSLYFTIHQLVE